MEKENFSRPLDLKEVKITDGFWGREQELVRTEVIPYQWNALNDRVEGADPSFCMRNFKVAGNLMRNKKNDVKFVPPSYSFRGFNCLPEEGKEPEEDKFYGFVFQDSDFSKWIEAVGYSLINHPDPELEKTADEAIDIVCAAQDETGYLDTYYIIGGMDRIFTNLQDHHELYCFGHLLEGAISYYQATGKDKLLKAAERYADFVESKFGVEEGKIHGYPGHEIAEMALARLYELTGEDKYLKLSSYFLNQRGTKPYIFDEQAKERAEHDGVKYIPNNDPWRYVYYQANVPVRELQSAEGHAVRAVYLYSGMADVARLTGDEEMYKACLRLWDNITTKKLYITGGIGGTSIGEAFTHEYCLSNDLAYSETCAAIGLAFFARRMLEIEAKNSYGDVMEQALYNTVLAGMALDGKSFFYVNPLETVPEDCHRDIRKFHVKPVRQKWFGCACCPPNIARMVTSLGAYAYTAKEDTLFTHLYVGSDITVTLSGKTMDLSMESDFPWEGDCRMKVGKVSTDGSVQTLAFRLPGWCRHPEITTKVKAEAEQKDGYLYLKADWQEGDCVELHFPMEVRILEADSRVRDDEGKLAFMRGPITYCAEEADNGKDLHLIRVKTKKLPEIKVEEDHTFGHPTRSLFVPGLRLKPANDSDDHLYHEFAGKPEKENIKIRLIPYYCWANRGEGEMKVWIRQK